MKNLRKQDLLGLGIFAVIFVVFYLLFDQEVLDDYWETNVIMILINIILSVSLNLINGFTGQFSIGHAGFMAVGAYVSAIITVKLGMDFALALIVGTLAAAFLGFLIGMPTLRLDGDYWPLLPWVWGKSSGFHPEHQLCRRGFRFHGDSPFDHLPHCLLDYGFCGIRHQKLQEFGRRPCLPGHS